MGVYQQTRFSIAADANNHRANLWPRACRNSKLIPRSSSDAVANEFTCISVRGVFFFSEQVQECHLGRIAGHIKHSVHAICRQRQALHLLHHVIGHAALEEGPHQARLVDLAVAVVLQRCELLVRRQQGPRLNENGSALFNPCNLTSIRVEPNCTAVGYSRWLLVDVHEDIISRKQEMREL